MELHFSSEYPRVFIRRSFLLSSPAVTSQSSSKISRKPASTKIADSIIMVRSGFFIRSSEMCFSTYLLTAGCTISLIPFNSSSFEKINSATFGLFNSPSGKTTSSESNATMGAKHSPPFFSISLAISSAGIIRQSYCSSKYLRTVDLPHPTPPVTPIIFPCFVLLFSMPTHF